MDEQHSEDSNNYHSVNYEETAVSPKRQRFSRPKVCDSSFWSNENIQKLISTIKLHPAIWQTDSEAFKSRAQREVAWQEVSESFDNEIIDLNQLVAKWQNLRTQYRSVRAGVRKYALNQIDKKPAWRFYSQMLFIDNEMEIDRNNEVNASSSSEQSVSRQDQFRNIKPKREKKQKVVDTAFWSDENVFKLINAVKKRKSIWNFNDENYKLRGIREADWLCIDDEFQNKVPVNQLVAKWQNLRTTYRSVKNSAKRLQEERGILRTPNWKYFSHMSFLDADGEVAKQQIEETQTIEKLEDIESIAISEDYIFNDECREVYIQNDFEDYTINEHIDDNEANKKEFLQKSESDDIEVFGNFFVCELRKIRNEAHLEATKRKILKVLWQCIDEEPR